MNDEPEDSDESIIITALFLAIALAFFVLGWWANGWIKP